MVSADNKGQVSKMIQRVGVPEIIRDMIQNISPRNKKLSIFVLDPGHVSLHMLTLHEIYM